MLLANAFCRFREAAGEVDFGVTPAPVGTSAAP
jgi:hypothetical protein